MDYSQMPKLKLSVVSADATVSRYFPKTATNEAEMQREDRSQLRTDKHLTFDRPNLISRFSSLEELEIKVGLMARVIRLFYVTACYLLVGGSFTNLHTPSLWSLTPSNLTGTLKPIVPVNQLVQSEKSM